MEHAFQPSVISDKLLNRVAKISSKTGDIRSGFSMLLSAGLSAEREGESKIDAKDLQSAVKSVTRLEIPLVLKYTFQCLPSFYGFTKVFELFPVHLIVYVLFSLSF